ncbi:MAG TPA: hypothetical protein PKH07_01925, partial [bacterium]|nr:hypothetical protein [bacterium]
MFHRVKSVQAKISFWAGVFLFLTSALIVGFSARMMYKEAVKQRETALEDGKKKLLEQARNKARELESRLLDPYYSVQTINQIASGVKRDDLAGKHGMDTMIIDRPVL